MKRFSALCLLLIVLLLTGCAPAAPRETTTVNVAAMAGPTGMGLVRMMEDHSAEDDPYVFSVKPSANGAQLIMAGLLDGSIDFACLPCNVASTAYAKGADIRVAAINTLSVLYFVENGDSVRSLDDLAGKTVYTVNKGSTTEYSLQYLLDKAGIGGVTVVFEEQTVIGTRLLGDEPVVALLPEPFVSSVRLSDPSVRVALSLGDEWERIAGSPVVTGVLCVRGAFADAHRDEVKAFLDEYKASVGFAVSDTDEAAALIEKYGIVAKAAVAREALPNCRIAYIDGTAMKNAVNAYLLSLYEQNPAAIGGAVPDDAFYYGE